jgi:hypothetical protein
LMSNDDCWPWVGLHAKVWIKSRSVLCICSGGFESIIH